MNSIGDDIVVMIHHKYLNIFGVQFHPERVQFNTDSDSEFK